MCDDDDNDEGEGTVEDVGVISAAGEPVAVDALFFSVVEFVALWVCPPPDCSNKDSFKAKRKEDMVGQRKWQENAIFSSVASFNDLIVEPKRELNHF